MELHRNYKFRLYPTKTQRAMLDNHFFASNQAWNHALAAKKQDLEINASLPLAERNYTKDSILETAMKCALQQRGIKYHSGIVQESFKVLNHSLKMFFSKRKNPSGVGFPKFKSSKGNEQSFKFKNQNVSWNTQSFKIMKTCIRWNMHRDLPMGAKLNGVVVKRTADRKYWVVLNVAFDQEIQQNPNSVECGIDMNVKNLSVADTCGAAYPIPIPDFSKSKYLKSYKKVQQKLSHRYKKKNFSKKTKKLQLKLNKIVQKIKNCKEDFFHKTSKQLVDNHAKIIIEDLKIKDMKESEKTHLNRMISDVSWGSLIQKLLYKAQAKNVIVVQINPAFTSQRCSNPGCGHIHPHNRKTQSVFQCLKCGHTENADTNAAKNIRDYKHWFLEQKARWAQLIKSSQVSIDSSCGDSILLDASHASTGSLDIHVEVVHCLIHKTTSQLHRPECRGFPAYLIKNEQEKYLHRQ